MVTPGRSAPMNCRDQYGDCQTPVVTRTTRCLNHPAIAQIDPDVMNTAGAAVVREQDQVPGLYPCTVGDRRLKPCPDHLGLVRRHADRP